jgi:hypothetical protein
MNIQAHADNTAFAPHDSKWHAIDADSYDGPGCPIGFGPTEAEAIADLMEQLAEAQS